MRAVVRSSAPRRHASTQVLPSSLKRNVTINSDVLKFRETVQKNRLRFSDYDEYVSHKYPEDISKKHHTRIYAVTDDKLVNAGTITAVYNGNRKFKWCDVKLEPEYSSELEEMAMYIQKSFTEHQNGELYDISKMAYYAEEDFCLETKDGNIFTTGQTQMVLLKDDNDNPFRQDHEHVYWESMRNHFTKVQNLSKEVYLHLNEKISKTVTNKVLINQLFRTPKLKHFGGTDDDVMLLGICDNAHFCFLTPFGILPICRISSDDAYDYVPNLFESLEKKYHLRQVGNTKIFPKGPDFSLDFITFYEMTNIPASRERWIGRSFTDIQEEDLNKIWKMVKPRARLMNSL